VDIPSERPNRKEISATPGPPGATLSLTEGDLILGSNCRSAIAALVDENLPANAAYVRHAIDNSPDGTIPIPFEVFQQIFIQDQPEPVQRLIYDLLTPQPGGYMLDALDVAEVTTISIPAAYILAEDDRALASPGAEFAARIGVTPILVPGTHESLLTHPDQLAEALLAA